jgi:hypothetical protein
VTHFSIGCDCSVPRLNADLKTVTDSFHAAQARHQSLTEQQGAFDVKLLEQRESADRIERSISSMKDAGELFKRRVPQRFRDVVRAMDWLKANGSLLEGQHYFPVGMHIKVFCQYMYHQHNVY